MPVINFNEAKKLYYGSQEIRKVYSGSTLVWERKRTVTDKFFVTIMSGSIFGNANSTFVGYNTTVFNRLGIKLSDVSHYVGKSGKEYPVTFSGGSGLINVPHWEMYTQSENHTLVLK